LLKNNVDYLISQGEGTTFGELSKSTLKELKFKLPPLEEQKEIAEILSSLDDKIDLLHRQNKTLEEMAQTLFRQWFIEEAQDHWDEGNLEDEFKINMGQSPPGESYNEICNGVVFFQGSAEFSFRFPTQRLYTSEPRKTAEKFDTLISVRAPVGEINMVIDFCCIGRGLASIVNKTQPNRKSYTYHKMKYLSKEFNIYQDSGTVFGSLTRNNFNFIKTVIPDEKAIANFEEMASKFDYKIYMNSLEINLLNKFKEKSLNQLINIGLTRDFRKEPY
ncbi:MAG: restriction endonuclease subunit S, partial [Ignavibacteriaceae bacterium]|nr:restriction endonuclease subunit S [Ignavibacteriaceae bacterium]